MKHPYIGMNEPRTQKVIIYSDGSAFHLEGEFKGEYSEVYSTEGVTNITREYLEGKCVKIESPEHSDFVQQLAFNAGFQWSTSFGSVKHTDKKLLIFKSNGSINFGSCADYDDIQITIPLPPKAKSEPKEWPQVGDPVITLSGSVGILLIKNEDKDGMTVCDFDGEYALVYKSELSKPKTEAEILRDEFISDFERAYQDAGAVPSSMLSYNNIKAYAGALISKGWKKPQ